MALEHFTDTPVSLAELEHTVIRSDKGATMFDLSEAAQAYHVKATGYRTSMSALRWLRFPAIAYVRRNHFIIIDAVTTNHLLIRDPSIGELLMEQSEFLAIWQGEILIFEKQ
jgi:ABC-type bacteriocin/lantibiotic exporter with double-glycine peptidase domain